MDIRAAGLEDAEAIARVHVLAWQGAYRGQIPDELPDALSIERRARGWRGTLSAQPQDGQPNWVAEADAAVVGFASVGPSRDDDASPHVGELYAIYVLPEYWGRAIGRHLMETAEDWLGNRFATATLWVLESNIRTRRFYESLGWNTDGTAKDDARGSFVLRELRYRRVFTPHAGR